jgi:hypothetical protein
MLLSRRFLLQREKARAARWTASVIAQAADVDLQLGDGMTRDSS